jgi:serine protease Do
MTPHSRFAVRACVPSAARAGLQAAEVARTRGGYVFRGGDTILAVNGEPLHTRDDLTLYLENSTRPGDLITLRVYRAGQELDVPVTVGEE